jgi:hypothetical protein
MGCHLGWHFPVGCPLGVAEENINNRDFCPPKIIKEKKIPKNTVHSGLLICLYFTSGQKNEFVFLDSMFDRT